MKTIRRMISGMLAFCMLFSWVPINTNATESKSSPGEITALETISVPEHYSDVSDTGQACTGSGTITDPYLISNASQLYWFAEKVNDGNVGIYGKLTEDIVVNENVLNADGTRNGKAENFRTWTPIGSSTNRYTGTFDGNNHTVSGLYFYDRRISYVGLFGCVDETGTVKNIGITDSYLNCAGYVGGVVGANYGTVTNCHNKGTVYGGSEKSGGGVVGFNYGTIENCYNIGSVSGSSGSLGGIAGSNDGTIVDCYNKGSADGDSSGNVGGIVGDNGGNIENCYNNYAIYGFGHAGGVAGFSYGTITNCYNTGTVNAGMEGGAGGVVGYNRGTVTNCYNTNSVASSGSYIGGVVGDNIGTVTNCYSKGSVRGLYQVGAVVGYNYGNGRITNCYFDSTVYPGDTVGTNQSFVDKLSGGKTTEQFASGEVAYLLNGDQSNVVFKQTIGTDVYPNFNGLQVYVVMNCVGMVEDYSNTEIPEGGHKDEDENHLCDFCDATVSDCIDMDKDIICDICKEILGIWGDANDDGETNSIDASLILQYDVKLIDETKLNLSVLDVNGDSEVNSIDASLILQYDVKLITSFPVENQK